MKIYEHEYSTPDLMRVNIKQHKSHAKHFAVTDVSQSDLMLFFREHMALQKVNPLLTNKVNVEIRQYANKKNGKAVSFSVFGMNPESVYDILFNAVKKKEEASMLRCPNCGSTDVEYNTYVKVNTVSVPDGPYSDSDVFCNGCDEHCEYEDLTTAQ